MPAGPVTLKLLVISRDTLLDVPDSISKKVFRALAALSRSGRHLLISAPEPDRWVPTRGNVDNALNQQQQLMGRINDAGGSIEGVYYVPRSLLTQDRNREGALSDILKRFSVSPDEAALLSSSTPFINAAKRLGLVTHEISSNGASNLDLLGTLKIINNQ
jgi:hypothetical protein